jgi:hypothetical protein
MDALLHKIEASRILNESEKEAALLRETERVATEALGVAQNA